MSVRVFVILYETRLVGMGVGVGLPIVAVFVLVFDVVVIVQDVGMRMCHILVGVLMGVLCGHRPCSLPGGIASAEVPFYILISDLIGPRLNRCYTPRADCWQVFSAT